jgi:hypothetical protein
MMKKALKRLMSMSFLSAALVVALPSHAVEYVFGETAGGSFSEVASLKIEDIVGVGTKWTLSAVFTGHADAFVKSLDYTYAPPPNPLQMTNFQSVSGVVALAGGNNVSFDNGVDFNTSNSNPSLRFTPGETVSWNFAGTTAQQFTNMDTHINVWSNSQSMKFDAMAPVAAIPEPETYVMWLAGLGVLFLLVRRQKQGSAKNLNFA